MKKAGFDATSPGSSLTWQFVDGRYASPNSYKKVLSLLQEDVQLRMQSLLLGDLNASPDDATPPKYQELVERYYQVLSRDSGRKVKAPMNGSAPANEKK
jgi:hypothetical protein